MIAASRVALSPLASWIDACVSASSALDLGIGLLARARSLIAGSASLVGAALQLLGRGEPRARDRATTSLQRGDRRVELAAHAVVDDERRRGRPGPASTASPVSRVGGRVALDDQHALARVDGLHVAVAATPASSGSAARIAARRPARRSPCRARRRRRCARSRTIVGRRRSPASACAQAQHAAHATMSADSVMCPARSVQTHRRSRRASTPTLPRPRRLASSRDLTSLLLRLVLLLVVAGDERAPRLRADRALRLPHDVELAVGLALRR